MIISASRRTDIPAFYADWLMNRFREGYVLTRNPINPKRVGRVILDPDVVDCIVFWSKNPGPMLGKLKEIEERGYPFYFQFTLTPYGKTVEEGLPPKAALTETFKRLSDRIGAERVVWRYDPVIVNGEFGVPYHLEAFGKMADSLGDYTERCVFSYVDLYAKMKRRARGTIDEELTEAGMNRIAEGFAQIAAEHRIRLSTCSEKIDLGRYGISHGSCIDQEMIENIIGCPIKAKKDANQRATCGCIESVDIGGYDSCPYGCLYCYATSSREAVLRNMRLHDKRSPLLIGEPNPEDLVTDREAKSLKESQPYLF